MSSFLEKTAVSLINTLVARLVDPQTLARIKQLIGEAAAFADLKGPERRNYVLEQIAKNYQYITAYVPSWLVNLAIEALVAQMKVSK